MQIVKNTTILYEPRDLRHFLISLLSLLEEEELIWLFSSISLLLLFLRKPDELGVESFFDDRIALP